MNKVLSFTWGCGWQWESSDINCLAYRKVAAMIVTVVAVIMMAVAWTGLGSLDAITSTFSYQQYLDAPVCKYSSLVLWTHPISYIPPAQTIISIKQIIASHAYIIAIPHRRQCSYAQPKGWTCTIGKHNIYYKEPCRLILKFVCINGRLLVIQLPLFHFSASIAHLNQCLKLHLYQYKCTSVWPSKPLLRRWMECVY